MSANEKTCSQCGKLSLSTMRICPACGSRSFDTQVTSQPASVHSPTCTSAVPPSRPLLSPKPIRTKIPLIQIRLLSSRAILGLVAVAILTFGILLSGTDFLASTIVDQMAPAQDREISDASPIYQGSLNRALPPDNATSESIRAIGDKLVAALPQDTVYQYRFRVLQDDSINAFALPGGAIFVHTGLLRMTSDPEQIAAVLAHEIIHVEKRHGIKSIVALMGKITLFEMVFGIFADQTAELSATLSILKYSRDKETEADLEGAKLMESAGYPRAAMVNMLNSLAEHGSSGPAWLSDHPDSHKRARRVAGASH